MPRRAWLVRSPEHNAGHTVRVLGPRRIVMVFDPATDDVEMLRTVGLLLRIGALAATSRQDLDDIRDLRERVAEAVTALRGIDEIAKQASAIHKGADRVSTQADALRTQLTRLLGQAMNALDGVVPPDFGSAASSATASGDAA